MNRDVEVTNKLVGVALMLLGLVMLGFGAYQLFDYPEPAADPDLVKMQMSNRCEASLNQLKIPFSASGGSINTPKEFVLRERGVDSPKETLTRASLALHACHGYRIKSFCFGSACPGMGLVMIMAIE
ncbi:hypothetical protein [Thioalkalivibrio thiocyanodenitrificans]|uniref:hypothetical protein n=1 Tax=Thioalkalivibrio thiocyanodenitrificans TaxID=243063 RepID=UPI00036F6E5D|nr:hypothetical protein [Thioalkalivibrio thiocyanodenitrificans]